MKKMRSVFRLFLVMLCVCMFGACAGDANSGFGSKGKKAYIKSMKLDLTNRAGGALTIGTNDYTKPSVYPDGLPNGFGFDKSVFNYSVLLQGEPEKVKLLVKPDNSNIDILYKIDYVGNGVAYDLTTVEFDPDDVIDPEVSLEVSVNYDSPTKDTVVVFSARSADAQETIYCVRFLNAHRDISLRNLSPYSINETTRAQYVQFDNAKYSSALNAYRLRFMPSVMQVRAVVNYPYSTIEIDDGGSITNVPIQYDETNKAFAAIGEFKFPAAGTRQTVLTITSEDGTENRTIAIDWTRVVFEYTGPKMQYTTDPYMLNGSPLKGGIKQLKSDIEAVDYGNFKYYNQPGIRIKGVITGTGVYVESMQTKPSAPTNAPAWLGNGTAETHRMGFFIEDSESGIIVMYPTPEKEPLSVTDMPFAIGDMVEITITHGRYHFNDLTAVFDPDAEISMLDTVDSFHYEPLTYEDLNSLLPNGSASSYPNEAKTKFMMNLQGRVVSYSGYIFRVSSGQSNAPTFNTWYVAAKDKLPPFAVISENYGPRLYIRSYGYDGTDWWDIFTDEKVHTYYGPMFYSFSYERMNIFHPGQID